MKQIVEYTGRTVAALLVTVALGVAGCAPAPEKATDAPAAPSPGPGLTTETAASVVAMTVDGTGFHPNQIAARVGQPITLAITRTTDETCGTEIVIPSFAINAKLPLNQRVEVTVTPSAKGAIAFACGMDMLKGTIVAE